MIAGISFKFHWIAVQTYFIVQVFGKVSDFYEEQSKLATAMVWRFIIRFNVWKRLYKWLLFNIIIIVKLKL